MLVQMFKPVENRFTLQQSVSSGCFHGLDFTERHIIMDGGFFPSVSMTRERVRLISVLWFM